MKKGIQNFDLSIEEENEKSSESVDTIAEFIAGKLNDGTWLESNLIKAVNNIIRKEKKDSEIKLWDVTRRRD